MEPIQIPSFRVQIMGYAKEDGFTVYNIKVYSVDDTSFHVNDRYRNMRSLWEEIRADAINIHRIPDFPPKKWFGSKSKDFLETRKTALQNFFNTLLESPDKNIFNHIMRYFSKLAKNREAKDALSSIQEAATKKKENKKPKSRKEDNKVDSKPSQRQTAQRDEEEKASKVTTKRENYQENKVGVISKDYNENCSKIVDDFNKGLIDLGYNGADAIQDIMAKGHNYVKHFEESNLNSDFNYETRLLDIPEGDNDNLALLDNPDEEAEIQNDEVNEALQNKLSELTEKLGRSQYEQFISMNEVIWRGN